MINFKGRQDLKFEKGVNFLIGANATGKSSILELIRRCHSNRLNSSVSNLHDKTKPGFIICRYENCRETLGDVAKDIKEIERDVALLCYFQEKNNGLNIIHKCVYFRGKGREIYITVSRKEGEKVHEQGLRKYTKSDFEKFDDFFDIYFEEKEIDQGVQESATELSFLDGIKSSFQNPSVADYIFPCQTEDILDPLSRTFAFIFADRSFGPLQWINGSNVKELNADQNYEEAQNRAEILCELLPTDEKDVMEFRSETLEADEANAIADDIAKPESAYIDEEKERDYFNLITYPLEYHFKKSSRMGKITVKMANDDREVEFVKAPEGVIESKQAALVFSHRKFKTICYEDIDRGMHDQMIENLNNLVLKQIEDKTVIIVTHNPSFMTGWAMERTHICSRQKSDQNLNIVTKVPSGYKFGVHEAMKKALFSARVLLVEGITDMLILQSLFQYIIEFEEAQMILAKRLEKEHQLIVQQISKTQIIPFGGMRMGKGVDFLKAINIQVFTLKDTDKSPERIVANFKWKSGTIEDVLKNDCPKRIRNLVIEDVERRQIKSKHHRTSEGKKMLKSYEECVSDGSYKDILKNLVTNGLKDDIYTGLYEELFQSINKYDKQKDDDHKQKEENQKYHVQKDDKQEDNEQKDDDHKQKEENKKDHVQKDDKQEDNEQKDDDHKQKEENQKDPVRKDDKQEDNEQKDDDHKQQEENQKDHVQKDDKPKDNEQKDDDHKQKEENQKDHVQKDDKPEDNEQKDDGHKQKEENQKDHVQKDDKPENNEQKDDKENDDKQVDHEQKAAKKNEEEENVDMQNNVKQKDDSQQKENRKNENDDKRKDDEQEDNKQMVIDMLEFLNFIINRP
ncbi:hypothetical protein FSP39_001350 [Pinctada imbricata]|uniref:OLD protein-like TOPRIM domain-containing protein n=1 Tax=Pinctada imbricata TaxID=66713 RepID=A0AA88Y4C8_PINIB|nr:hypothetical protein FSP39_001350 [Pinctada imbricata]